MNFHAFSSLSELITVRQRGLVSAAEVAAFFKKRCIMYDTQLRSLIEIFEDQIVSDKDLELLGGVN